ncbi:DoxX family protein [Shigella flexneri]
MIKLEDVGVLVARILMPILFITAGWGKVPGYAGTQQYIEAMGVPGFMLLTAFLFGKQLAEGINWLMFMKNLNFWRILLLAITGPGAFGINRLLNKKW